MHHMHQLIQVLQVLLPGQLYYIFTHRIYIYALHQSLHKDNYITSGITYSIVRETVIIYMSYSFIIEHILNMKLPCTHQTGAELLAIIDSQNNITYMLTKANALSFLQWFLTSQKPKFDKTRRYHLADTYLQLKGYLFIFSFKLLRAGLWSCGVY